MHRFDRYPSTMRMTPYNTMTSGMRDDGDRPFLKATHKVPHETVPRRSNEDVGRLPPGNGSNANSGALTGTAMEAGSPGPAAGPRKIHESSTRRRSR